MQFDSKFLTLLVFVVINFLILFIVKTRTSLVVSIIAAHLVAVLFFSLSIEDYASFREITLALIIYSMVILFLISNYGSILVDTGEEKKLRRSFAFRATLYFIALVVFLLLLSVVKNVNDLHRQEHQKSSLSKRSDSTKTIRLRRELEDNFLLKRSSDVILIIVAASTLLLLISKKEQ